MTTHLKTLEFLPAKDSAKALHTGTRKFGETLTLVLGPNGSGKTPLLKGLAYALGLPAELPPRIREGCDRVSVVLAGVDDTYGVERTIGAKEYRVRGPRGSMVIYDDEKFAAWMIEALGIPHRQFATHQNQVSEPFMSVLLPMFWIDQDLGWRDAYAPLKAHNFYRDQHEEVARWLLGLPSRNRPVDKSDFAKAKARLESAQQQVEVKRNTVAALKRELGALADAGGAEALTRERETLLADLNARTAALTAFSKTTSALDERIAEAGRETDKARFAFDSAKRRMNELHRLREELLSEVEVLGMNEVAADAFRTLCDSKDCGFFRKPEESYGRRLLYLKDQLKDFDTSFKTVAEEVAGLERAYHETEGKQRQVVREKQASAATTPEGQIMPVIDGITKRLAEVALRKERVDRLAAEQRNLEALINRVLRAREQVDELRPTGGVRSDQGRLLDVRTELAKSTERWLTTLKAQNLPGGPTFNDSLQLHLGSERFTENSSISGSTRTRVVLAYHAAVVETSLKLGGHHPGFLILDAPKQHELHAEDLGAFVREFQEMSMAQKGAVQIVIGATQEDFVDEALAEEVWRPSFDTEDGPRFFGPPADG